MKRQHRLFYLKTGLVLQAMLCAYCMSSPSSVDSGELSRMVTISTPLPGGGRQYNFVCLSVPTC